MGDLGSIPWLGRAPGDGKGYPLQYSGLENSRDWIVHGVVLESDSTECLSLSAYLSINVLMDTYLDCFYTLTIINKATMNIEVHASFQISVWGAFI